MKAAAIVIGAIILVVGEIGAFLFQTQLAEYEKLVAQTDEALILAETSSVFQLIDIQLILHLLKYSSIFIGIAGIAVLIYGVVAKEKHKKYCKHCGALLPHEHTSHNS
jgi:hypothetical protein